MWWSHQRIVLSTEIATEVDCPSRQSDSDLRRTEQMARRDELCGYSVTNIDCAVEGNSVQMLKRRLSIFQRVERLGVLVLGVSVPFGKTCLLFLDMAAVRQDQAAEFLRRFGTHHLPSIPAADQRRQIA